MIAMGRRFFATGVILAAGLGHLSSCDRPDKPASSVKEDPNLTARGTIELTARLLEIPEGAIFKRDLYNYATILKYEVLKVHRGELTSKTIFVGHYNPWKPRSEAADRRIKNVGGDVRRFKAGEVHRLALDVPIDDFYMGGIVNKYFGQETGPLYWAAWTNGGKL